MAVDLAVLDRLPAPVRHFAIVFLGSAVAVLSRAILDANGVTGLDWASALVDALNGGVTAAVSGVVLNAVLPFDSQYGMGKAASVEYKDVPAPEGVAEDTE